MDIQNFGDLLLVISAILKHDYKYQQKQGNYEIKRDNVRISNDLNAEQFLYFVSGLFVAACDVKGG